MNEPSTAFQIGSIVGMIFGGLLMITSPVFFIWSLIQSFRTRLLPWILLACYSGIYCLFILAIIVSALVSLILK